MLCGRCGTSDWTTINAAIDTLERGLRKMTSREANVETFISFYGECLRNAVLNHPEEYGYDADKVPETVGRMRQAFIKGSYNYDSRAIRETCKKIGIKSTRKAIEEFFNTPREGVQA